MERETESPQRPPQATQHSSALKALDEEVLVEELVGEWKWDQL